MAVDYLGATNYQIGYQGTDVQEIQTLLMQRGYSPGPIDGVFGPATKTAVMRFQSDRGFTIDGIVGPMTWAALHGTLPQGPAPAALPRIKVTPLPTELVLQPGTVAQVIPGTSPVTLVIAGLGLLTVATMAFSKTGRGTRRWRKR